jgi:hypothetical protein
VIQTVPKVYGQNIKTDTLGGLAIVVPKHSTETFSPLDLSVLLSNFIILKGKMGTTDDTDIQFVG